MAEMNEVNRDVAIQSIPKVQITLKSGLNMRQFRDLTADTMNKLVRMPGIVISASVLSSRATKLLIQCRSCRGTQIMYPPGGMGGMGSGSDRSLPRICSAESPPGQKKDCPMDPYLIVHSKSTFADQQTLKLQEAPDMVPVGELPRHMMLSADRALAGQVVPGSRVIATGIYSTFQSAKKVGSVLGFICFPCAHCFTEGRWGCRSTKTAIPPCHSPGAFVSLGIRRRFQPFRRPIFTGRRRRVC